jgi:hypothetical protein
MSVTRSLTAGRFAPVNCPEAFPLVFSTLQQSSATLQRRWAALCSAGGGRFDPAPLLDAFPLGDCKRDDNTQLLLDTLLGSSALSQCIEVECASRVKAMLDLSLVVKPRITPGGIAASRDPAADPNRNSLAFMRQAGWQGWLLDLMHLPHTNDVNTLPDTAA